MENRPVRVCDICGGVDDHPRHVIGLGPNDPAPAVDQAVIAKVIGNPDLSDEAKTAIVADLADTSLQLRHMDCCRDLGCPDGTCELIAETGARDLRGSKLHKHLTSGKVDSVIGGE